MSKLKSPFSFFQRVGDGAQPRVRDLVRRGEGHNPAGRAAPARDAQAQPHPGAAQISGAKGIYEYIVHRYVKKVDG